MGAHLIRRKVFGALDDVLSFHEGADLNARGVDARGIHLALDVARVLKGREGASDLRFDFLVVRERRVV